ncbi:peptidoglycan-binding protein [Agromyces sp. NPDC058126]|uniref:peptidoglycan-binding domain-containing protein n=1 Tax=Agromyces sp. NPDC058126 TaxID=3346350 RepID=UPI0036DAA7C5
MKTLKSRLAGGALALAIAVGCAVAPAAAASANTGSTGKGCTAYQYSSGGYATCVGYIQRMLNGIAYSRGPVYGGYQLAVDNSFGGNTNTNVRRFQSYVGLTSDGVVGRNTWYQLCRYAGTRSFALSNAHALQKSAWNAAYEAGCYVDVPVGPAGIKVISKY